MYFSSSILTDFTNYALTKDISENQIENGIANCLETKSDHPEYITYAEIVKVFNFFNQILDDPYLGLHIGEQISLKVTAYVDQIMNHSATLEEAFENAVTYSKLISDALECNLETVGTNYHLSFEENPDWRIQQQYTRQQIIDLTMISALKSILSYTNKAYYPVEIRFNHNKPEKLGEYYRLFNCRLKFNQPETTIIFEKYLFEFHSKSVEAGLLEGLKLKVDEVLSEINQEAELIYRVKKCILRHKPDRINIDQVTHELNMSRRSLQRGLNQNKTTFRAIEHDLQLKLAQTYLEEDIKNIDEISYLLGFSESSAFIRFFKSKINSTPSQYRKQVLTNK